MQIGQKAGKAGILLFVRKVWAGVLNVFVLSYLARVLNKEDFGLVAISGVLVSIMDIFWQSISEYLIYKKASGKDSIINGAFWLNVIVVLFVIAFLIGMAPLVADYYHNYKIKYLIYLLAFGCVGGIFANIPQAVLKRNFEFRPIIVAQTVTGTLSQLTQLGLAIMGLGVYSLAIPSAIFPLATGVYLFIIAKPKLEWDFGMKYWREIIAYTRFIIGNKILSRISSDGDSLIIGKVLGLTSLGVYNIASRFSGFLTQNLMPILDDVGFPLFTKYNDNRNIVRKQFLYVTRLISLFLMPFYVLLILFAPLIIQTLCGDKWMDAVLPLRILTCFTLVECITYSTSILYGALGKPKVKFYFTFIFAPVFLFLVWKFSSQGLVIGCITVTILRVINFVYHVFRVGSMINLSFSYFIKEIQHVLVPNILLAILYALILVFLHNVNVKYLMMISYVPIIYLISYRLYKKDMLKNYVLIGNVFPAFKFH